MSDKIKIGIIGAYGKMGSSLIEVIKDHPNLLLAVAVVRKKTHDILGTKLIESAYLDNFLAHDKINVLIDFSCAKATCSNVQVASKHKVKIVIGTTGLSDVQNECIKCAKNKIGIVQENNFSIGIHVILSLLNQTSKVVGKNSDVQILEIHHKEKKDMPSGTALQMGKVIAQGMDKNYEDATILKSKYKKTLGKDREGKIGYSCMRLGRIVGEHTACFCFDDQEIFIGHKALSRSVFAKGAVRAAIWLNCNPNSGLFSMKDVLSL